MKKQIKFWSMISVFVTMISLIILPANAASYPSIIIDNISNSVVVGDSIGLDFTIFREFKNENYYVDLYNSSGNKVASASGAVLGNWTFNVTINIDTKHLNLSPGEYKIKYYMEFYSFYEWHFAPTQKTAYLTIVENKCNSNHKFGSWESFVSPTCIITGKDKRTCSVCNHFEFRDVKGEHKWDSGVITTPPTCTANGIKTFTCTECNEKKTETVNARHNWNTGAVTLKETCTSAGTKLYTCIDCAQTKTETIPAAGHKWNNGKIVNEATYLIEGSKEFTCTICSEKRTEIINKKSFNDVPAKKWFKQYVDYVAEHGIFTGTSKTEFSPSMNITRAQFVQVLANITGVDTSNRNVTTSFNDVPSKKWYTSAVKWASENKVVNGMGKGKFEPNTNVTREQMCVMLVNFAKLKNITFKSVESKENFADDSKISKWAKTAVYICQMADIVNGKGAGSFDPTGTGTRAEASVMFTKFHKDYLIK